MKRINLKSATLLLILMMLIPGQLSFGKRAVVTFDQELLTIRGKVTDSATDVPLVFAGITAKGTNISTVTNIDGEFLLKIYRGEATEIEISHVGYKNKTLAVNELRTDDRTNYIELDVLFVPISEIVVKPIMPDDILTLVLGSIRKNYETIPNEMTGFYRETVRKNRSYLSIGEAVVEIFKAPYDNSFRMDGIRIYKGRKNDSAKDLDTVLFKLQGGTTTSLELDFVKNSWYMFTKEELEKYDLRLTSLATIDDRSNYVIEFEQRPYIEEPLMKGKIWVDMQTFAIAQIEFSLNLKDKERAASMLVRKKPIGMRITPENTAYLVKYKISGEKWHFAYSRAEVTFKVNWAKKLFSTTYSTVTEMAITDRVEEDVLKFSAREKMKPSDIFVDEVRAFVDEDFWGDYNVIEPDQSIENAIRRLSRGLRFEDRTDL
ncbi:MAG: carboxypeptidase-like regulatory domain-containing protein [Bacteroidales bacterium]|jgi:hypothetical protein